MWQRSGTRVVVTTRTIEGAEVGFLARSSNETISM